RNNLEYALPLLQKSEQKAEIFLLADHDLSTNTWDPDEGDGSSGLMTLPEKKSLPLHIYGIGSHGLSHQHYPELPETEVQRELSLSKQILERDLHTAVKAFAYPFGSIDRRLPRLAQDAGYDFAVNTDQGPVYWFTERFSLFRANVF